MSSVGPVSPSGSATTPVSLMPPASPDAPSLLPEPAADALAGTDPLSMLYLFESKDQKLGVASGTTQIQSLQSERHDALKQLQDAIQKAIDAEKNRSFWDSLGSVFGEVAKVAAVVASVAATVFTAGAAAPGAVAIIVAVVGATLSSAAFVDGEFHVLQSLGVDPKTAGWIDTGMALGGMVGSVGTALLAGGQAASGALTAVSQTAAAVTLVGGVGRGVSTIEAGDAQAGTDQAAADEVASQAISDHVQRLMQMVIAYTQSSDQQSQHAMQTIASTKTIQNQTTVSAATAVRG